MERRKFLEMLIVGSLAEYIGGCASAPVPAIEIVDAPTMRNTLPQGFQQADHLFINTNPSAHYYVDGLSKRKGLYQLRDLAKTSDVEEGFVHVQAGTRSLWFEIGEQEEITKTYGGKTVVRRQQVNLGKVIVELLIPELQEMGLERMKITTSHLHPQKMIDDSRKNFSYNYGSSHSDGRLFKVRWSSEVRSLPSPDDILNYVIIKELFQFELKGKMEQYENYVVTPTGYFTFDVNELFSRKVIEAVEKERLNRVSEELNYQIGNTLANTSNKLGMVNPSADILTLDLETALQALREDNLWKDIPIHYHPF